jgi:hypothetical protein
MYIVSEKEITWEKRISVVIMILLPLPCLAYAIWLARLGYATESWVYLGVSLLLEILAAAERSLLIRGLEGIVLSLLPEGLHFRWVGEQRDVRDEDWLETGIERGFLTGRAQGIWFRTVNGRWSLPWFARASDFIDALRKRNRKVLESRVFPFAPLVACLGLAGCAAGHAFLHLPLPAIGPLLVLSLGVLFFAYPLHPVLGPQFHRWDRFLAGSVVLLAVGLTVVAAGFLASNGYPPPLFPLPEETGEARSQRIFRLGRSRHRKALPALQKLCTSPHPRDRRDSALALGYRGGREAFLALYKATQDPHPEVRQAAVFSLGSLRNLHTRGLLIEILRKDSDLGVVREANRALERMTGRTFHAGIASKFLREEDRWLAAEFWKNDPGEINRGDQR